MMENLFIVKSPLQIINAIEAIEYFKLENNILLILHDDNKKNSLSMSNIAQMREWDIILHKKKVKKVKFLRDIFFIKKITRKKYHYVFTSHITTFHRLLLSNVSANRIIYLDDGIETIVRYKDSILKNNLNKFNVKYLKYLFFGLKFNICYPIHFFTYFDLQDFRNSKIIRNDLKHFQKKYFQNMQEDEVTYILGQPLVKVGFLTQDDYFLAIDRIREKKGGKIVYIPHRNEIISERLKSYEGENFELRDINMPVELYFLEQKIYPKEIVSFITTAFFTLHKLYSKTHMCYVYIPKEKILRDPDIIENHYASIAKLGIERLEL